MAFHPLCLLSSVLCPLCQCGNVASSNVANGQWGGLAGAEMASSISGDDIRTVMRYYADPSAVHVENVRVVDLL